MQNRDNEQNCKAWHEGFDQNCDLSATLELTGECLAQPLDRWLTMLLVTR